MFDIDKYKDESNFDAYQKDPTLDEILNFTSEQSQGIDMNVIDFNELLKEAIPDDNVFTISLNYDPANEEAKLVIQGVDPAIYKKHMDPEEYMELCKIAHIEENDDYNMSKSFQFGGKKVRSFALTRPLSPYPTVTISSVKEPPTAWHQIELEKVLPIIAKESFLIVGASGAGKTYFMNYMLKECHKNSKEKIGMIEEFDELLEPNDAACKIVSPPRKPGEKGLLQFITEQSNLMRLKYLYVGEIKGPEAWPFVNNLASGTIGGATIHGESVKHGLQRLKSLCLLSNTPEKTIEESIAKSLTYVLYLENHNVMEIQRLTGVSMNGNFSLQDVWRNPELQRQENKKKKIMMNEGEKFDYNDLNEYSNVMKEYDNIQNKNGQFKRKPTV